VAALTPAQRVRRVLRLTEQAHRIVTDAWEIHGQDRNLVATCVLFSGGNDSTVLTHMMRRRADYAVHCNTTIGIEATRQFVRDTCAAWDLPLIEKFPPKTYRELVIEHGFPGPGHHWKMFQRIKERQMAYVRNELIRKRGTDRVLYIAGRRRSESARRVSVPLHEVPRAHALSSTIFASPLAMWTKLDMNTYRQMHGDVPVNEVSELLHMSGECLCGAFAKDNELEEIRLWFPEVAAEIDALQAEVKAAGIQEPFCRWGHRQGRPSKKTGALCTSCEFTEGNLRPELA